MYETKLGAALALKKLEPEKSPAPIFCRQFVEKGASLTIFKKLTFTPAKNYYFVKG